VAYRSILRHLPDGCRIPHTSGYRLDIVTAVTATLKVRTDNKVMDYFFRQQCRKLRSENMGQGWITHIGSDIAGNVQPGEA